MVEENRRLNSDSGHGSSNGSNKNSIILNTTNELPVENFVLQSQVDTLQWQLQQVRKHKMVLR